MFNHFYLPISWSLYPAIDSREIRPQSCVSTDRLALKESRLSHIQPATFHSQKSLEKYEQLHNTRKNRIEQPAKTPKRRGRPPKKVTKAVAKFAGIFKRKAS